MMALAACSDQNLAGIRLDTLAVSLGDFDDMAALLNGLDVAHTPYDGFIVQAIYEPEGDRTQRDSMQLSVETLLDNVDDKGRLEINLYSALFLNSGTRGLGLGRYNDTLTADDEILGNPDRVEAICKFVESGRILIASDWTYDVLEACWPDAIEFVNDDAVVDDAQRGRAGSVSGVVRDEAVVEALGGEAFAVSFDYSAWSVIESVGADTEVLLEGTVEYQPASDQDYQTLTDAPLLVRFPAGQGQVVYSSYHWSTQNRSSSETLLVASVPGMSDLVGGGGEETAE